MDRTKVALQLSSNSFVRSEDLRRYTLLFRETVIFRLYSVESTGLAPTGRLGQALKDRGTVAVEIDDNRMPYSC